MGSLKNNYHGPIFYITKTKTTLQNTRSSFGNHYLKDFIINTCFATAHSQYILPPFYKYQSMSCISKLAASDCTAEVMNSICFSNRITLVCFVRMQMRKGIHEQSLTSDEIPQ